MENAKRYSFFPGCALDGTAVAYKKSILEVARVLGMELAELEDWNCCGSTASGSVPGVASHSIAARNLALATRTDLSDLVTPCSACYTVLKNVQANLERYPELGDGVEKALGERLIPYKGFRLRVRVRHLLEVIMNDVGLETIASKKVRSLNGLKVAPYYGCQVVRPWFTFDDPEFPKSLDRLMETLGGVAVLFPFKTHCCGASLMLAAPEVGLDAVRWIVDGAEKEEADCIVTVCPLCQTNLEAYQGRINRKLGTNYNMPVLFFTQLLGFALGVSPSALGLGMGLVPQERVLAKVGG
jgi:heterodisulfide reductase subunit B